jgi:hypothetical protein
VPGLCPTNNLVIFWNRKVPRRFGSPFRSSPVRRDAVDDCCYCCVEKSILHTMMRFVLVLFYASSLLWREQQLPIFVVAHQLGAHGLFGTCTNERSRPFASILLLIHAS